MAPSPVLAAAAPSLIAMLQAVQQFTADMGPDPSKWPLVYPGASLKLMGAIDLQLPGLVASEVGAVQTDINAKVNSWISALQAAAKS